jgi:release factor glutamine methyltransferase
MANQHPGPSSPARIWTTLDLIRWTKDFFSRKGIESARLEAELLLAAALGCDRIRLYTDFEAPVSEPVLATFRDWVRRRAEQREPLAYILGHSQFLELELAVTPAVLIPRPETEELALWARGLIATWADQPEVRVLDVGTGSGCLALALARHSEKVHALALDIARDALAVAEQNASSLGLEERVRFVVSDVYAGLKPEEGPFDLIVANPPYIAPELQDTLQPEVRTHEPKVALYAEKGGMSVIEPLVTGAADWLKPGGWLGLEISPELAQDVCARIAETGAFKEVEVRKDVRQMARFVTARAAGDASL